MRRPLELNDIEIGLIVLAKGMYSQILDFDGTNIEVGDLLADGTLGDTRFLCRVPHPDVYFVTALDYAVQQLINARALQSEAQAQADALNEEVQHIYDRRTRANKAVTDAANVLREVAKEQAEQGQALPYGLQVKFRSGITFDRYAVLEWLAQHMPDLLTIDMKKFEQLASGMPTDMRNRLGVKNVETPFITIPKDLSLD